MNRDAEVRYKVTWNVIDRDQESGELTLEEAYRYQNELWEEAEGITLRGLRYQVERCPYNIRIRRA